MESEVAVAGACDGEVPPQLEGVGSFAGLSSEEEVDASTITVASGGVVGEVDHEEIVTYSSSRIVATDEVCILVKCVAFIDERIALMKRCSVFLCYSLQAFGSITRSMDESADANQLCSYCGVAIRGIVSRLAVVVSLMYLRMCSICVHMLCAAFAMCITYAMCVPHVKNLLCDRNGQIEFSF
jgi:hypothetical protein